MTDIQELVVANLPLVHHLLKKYRLRSRRYEEFFQIGVLGLLRAAQLYEPGHKAQFGTYAYYWIRQAISRQLQREKKRKEQQERLVPRELWQGPRVQRTVRQWKRDLHFADAIKPEYERPENVDPEQLEGWIRQLPLPYARVIRAWLAGANFREIGKQEGVSFQAIQQRYHRALVRLRALVAQGR